MAEVKAHIKKGLDQSEILASMFASVLLITIIVISGHWEHYAFWLAAVLLVGLAYLASLIPDEQRVWRLPLLFIGYFSPGVFGWLFQSPDL